MMVFQAHTLGPQRAQLTLGRQAAGGLVEDMGRVQLRDAKKRRMGSVPLLLTEGVEGFPWFSSRENQQTTDFFSGVHPPVPLVLALTHVEIVFCSVS